MMIAKAAQKFLTSLALLTLLLSCEFAHAQQPIATTIQLPSVRVFQINTAVSVPDGGSMLLGGVSRSGYGSSSFGVPLLGNVPLAGRPFRNQASGSYFSSGMARAHVTILSNAEMEADVLAEANRRELLRTTIDPNGMPAVQRRADFISRNIGRR